MSTDQWSPPGQADNIVLRYVNDHPFVIGFWVFEAVLFVIAYLLVQPRKEDIGFVNSPELLNVLAGLTAAFALFLAIIALMLRLSLLLWSLVASGR